MQSALTEMGIFLARGEARDLFAELEHIAANLGLDNLPGLAALRAHIDRAGMSGKIPNDALSQPLPQRNPTVAPLPQDTPLMPPLPAGFQIQGTPQAPSFTPSGGQASESPA